METSSNTGRHSVCLPRSILGPLNMYALAAGSAAFLGLTSPASAKVVYTPANIQISPNSYVDLDLNHDGTSDVTIEDAFMENPLPSGSLYAKGQVVGRDALGYALNAGASVGPKSPFLLRGQMARYYSGTSVGQWKGVTERYLGVAFKISGQIHYGWARLDVRLSRKRFAIFATLTGYAYETVPNKAIVAGEIKTSGELKGKNYVSLANNESEPSLGLLALGAPGVSLWRRRDLRIEHDSQPVRT